MPTDQLPQSSSAPTNIDAASGGDELARMLSGFLARGSKRLARTPLMMEGVPQAVPTEAEYQAPTATTGLAGLARSATDAVAPRFGPTAQGVVEGMPRTALDVGMLISPAAPAGLADFGLSGYSGAREAGAGVPASLGAGAVGVAGGMLAGPTEKIGADLAARGLAKMGVRGVPAKIGQFAAGQTALGGTMTAQSMAQRSIETGSVGRGVKESLTPENIFGQIAGQVPFAAMGAHNLFEKPNAIGPDGQLQTFGSRTAMHANAPSGDPQTDMLNSFLGGAQTSTDRPSVVEAPSTEAMPSIDVGHPTPEAKLAHETFVKAAFPVQEQAKTKFGAGENFAEADADPYSEMAGSVRGVLPNGNHVVEDDTGSRYIVDPKTDRVLDKYDEKKHGEIPESGNEAIDIGSQERLGSGSTTEPDFSLINPFGADFSSKKSMTPPVILNSLLNGEIVPTNAPDNADALSLVDTLHRGFVTDESMAQGYVDMNKVGATAELANLQQRQIPLTQPQMASWSKLSPDEQQAAHVASKILNDPFTTMGMAPDEHDIQGNVVAKGGLDPRKWEVAPNFGPESFLRSVYQGAANMTEKWNRPITTVQDAAALVRDTNSFTDQVKGFMDQQGFGEAAQKQLTEQGLFKPITQENLQERYNSFMQEYLHNPSAEAAARSLQWVKNQVWLSARAAREVMMNRPEFANPAVGPATSKAQTQDMQLEKGFQDAMGKVPETMQQVLQEQYLRARKERPSERGQDTNPVWSMNDYRKGVADAINGLTPEDAAKLQSVDPKNARAVLDTIPVLRKNDEGKTIRTNLGKVVFEPKGSLAYAGSARFEAPEEAGKVKIEQPDEAALEDETPDEEQSLLDKPDDVRGEGRRAQAAIDKFFVGEPKAPSEVLGDMSPQKLKTAFVAAMDDKAKSTDNSSVWKNRMKRYAELVGKTPEEVTKDGSGDNWMREFLRVDAEGDVTQRNAWMKSNGFEGMRDWEQVKQRMLSQDSGKQLMWKARMMGLEPKIGTTPEQLRAEMGEAEKAPGGGKQAPVKRDFVGFIRKDLLNRGYQPELAETIAGYAKNMADNFWWVDNADFASLTDREGVAQRFYKQMQVMGMHLPDQTIVNGKPLKNPVIALMQKDLIQREGYAPLNTFLKITGFGHEAYHNLQKGVVENPDFKPTNEDTQTVIDSVHSMQAMASGMAPEDRAVSATALLDMMVPPKYARDDKGNLLPEVKGLVNAVSQNPKEYSAFMFQMATAGLGSRLSEFEGGSGVPRGDKIASDYQDALSWFSPDTIAFMRGQFRYLGDMLDSLQRVLDDPDFRAEKGLTYEQKETRQVNPKEGAGLSQTIHQGGRTSEIAAPVTTKETKATFTTPPTQGVGVRTRAVAEAALRIANQKPGGLQPPPKMPEQVVTPSQYAVIRALAKIDKRVEKATTMVKQLIDNMSGGLLEPGAKSIDLSDVQAPETKEFMASLGVPPGGAPPLFDNPVDAALAADVPDRKFALNAAARMFGTRPQITNDLARRGVDAYENDRRVTSRIWSTAHGLFATGRQAITARSERVGSLGRPKRDPQSAYAKFLGKNEGEFDTEANKAISKMALFQQENGGIDVTDPKMQQVIKDATSKMDPKQAAWAPTALKDMNQVYSDTFDHVIAPARDEHETGKIAAVIMDMNPGKFKSQDAMNVAKQAMDSARGIPQAQQALATLVKGGQLDIKSIQAVEKAAIASVDTINQLNQMKAAQGKFISEARFGKHVIAYTTEDGKRGSMGLQSVQEAKTFAGDRQLEGATNIKYYDKTKLSPDQLAAASYDDLEGIRDVVSKNHAKLLEAVAAVDPALAQKLDAEFDPKVAINSYAITDPLKKLTGNERKFKAGREYLNPTATMDEYTATAAKGAALRQAKTWHALYMRELTQMGATKQAADADALFKYNLTSTPETTRALTSIGTAFFLGLDLTRSLIDSTTPATTGIPVLHQETGSLPKSLAYTTKAMGAVAKYATDTKGFNASADRGKFMTESPLGASAPKSPATKADIVAHFMRRANDEGVLGHSSMMDTIDSDVNHLNLERVSKDGDYQGTTRGQMILQPAYQTAQVLLKAHGFLPNQANKVSMHAALSAAYDAGLRGDALKNKADSLYDQMTIAFGKANKPAGYAYMAGQGTGSEFRRSAVAFATMMQQFGSTQITSLGMRLRDAMAGAPGLDTQQRVNAGKAAATQVMMLAALSGGLGVPGVGLAIKAINYLTHKDPEAAIRTGLQEAFTKFISSDHDNARFFADTAMNGLVNAMTGIDVASRSGVSGLYGISPGGDASMLDAMGPGVSIFASLARGLSDVTAGKPWLGAKEMAPKSLKPLVEMYGNYKQFGDLRINDQNNNLLMHPTAAQAIGYALGGAPARVRSMRQEGRLMQTAQENYQIGRDAQITSYARGLLKGDTSPVMQEAYQRQFQVGFKPTDFINEVVEKALDMQTQKDPMTKGSVLNAQSQDAIGSTFDNPRASEMQRVQMKDQMLMKMGLPFGMKPASSQQYLQAALVDQLRQQRGMSRSEAIATIQRYFGSK